MPKRKAIFYLIAAIVVVLSAFTVFEFRVDGSLLGELWQFVRGNQVDYAGLRITLPRYWLAIRPADDMELVHMAGDRTAKIVLMTTPLNDPSKWEQLRPSWIESRNAKFESEGYEPTTIPTILAFGKPSTCLGFVPKNDRGKREIVCAIADGHMLAAFSGHESDVPTFTSIMDSVRTAPK
jgi:hypothetical protein